ncbi:hypothetical protein CI610_03311 [invertebrate metagenome]|uniref:Glycine transporter domain-containing protein n=1 Tax=invertebrate metagenome TaxID=1711999 RepID=A0A2H9T3F9_9ZZZZ
MLLYSLDLLGTAVFAVTGVLVACKKEMDLFGALVLAFVTAVGGGTVRDLLLNKDMVFWMKDSIYLYVVIISVAFGLILRYVVDRSQKALLIFDAVGLATFTIIGLQKSLGLGVHPGAAVMMGALTGAGGGAIRDVLAGEIPMVLKQDIYATAALLGGGVYIFMEHLGVSSTFSILGSSIVVFLLRLAAIEWRLSLPSWHLQS